MGPWQIFLVRVPFVYISECPTNILQFLLLCGFSMASPETGKRRSPEDPTPGGYNAAPPIPNMDDDTVARLIIGPNPWVLFLYREEHLTNANPDIKMLLIAVVFRQFVPRRVVRLAGPNVGLSITHELDHRLVTQFPGLTISDTQLVAPDGIDAEFMTLIAGRMWAVSTRASKILIENCS